MIDTVYAFRLNGTVNNRTLRDILVPAGGSEDLRAQAAVDALKKAISVKTAMKTGVVTFSVRTVYPELSHALTDDLLDRLNEFNMQARMARAGTERKFTESRLATVQAELHDAENRLQQFMQTNQDFRSSSRLSVYQDQLQRDVNTRQAVYTTLAQAYETARIEEVRNTPVIMVVQHARTPVRPDARRLVLRVIIAFLATAVLTALLALTREYFWGEGRTTQPPAVEEFKAVVRETVNDVKHPLKAIRGGKAKKRVEETG
ncbi:MAG TPA: hypothetical protein VJ840_03930 [Gemmatimonadaceae bacterium]|nr:hypothetical protein [Gemmatimonadaceae bacterium]